MRDRREELDVLNVQIYVITFESWSRINAFQRRSKLPFPLLRDPGRTGYRAFGLERRQIHHIWTPGTIWFYTRQLFRGKLPRLSRSDPYQLGGDVLLRPIRGGWIYASRHPADRPDVDGIFRILNQC